MPPSPMPRCTGCSTRNGRRAAIWFALKPGGRFAGEMGGEGNLARLREALDDVLVGARLSVRRPMPPTGIRASRSSPPIYEQAGFKDIDARLIERPTPLEHGVAAWVTTFRAGWLDRAGVPARTSASPSPKPSPTASASNIADYVRLRFIMRKP